MADNGYIIVHYFLLYYTFLMLKSISLEKSVKRRAQGNFSRKCDFIGCFPERLPFKKARR